MTARQFCTRRLQRRHLRQFCCHVARSVIVSLFSNTLKFHIAHVYNICRFIDREQARPIIFAHEAGCGVGSDAICHRSHPSVRRAQAAIDACLQSRGLLRSHGAALRVRHEQVVVRETHGRNV